MARHVAGPSPQILPRSRVPAPVPASVRRSDRLTPAALQRGTGPGPGPVVNPHRHGCAVMAASMRPGSQAPASFQR
jgi:hypothetical protein